MRSFVKGLKRISNKKIRLYTKRWGCWARKSFTVFWAKRNLLSGLGSKRGRTLDISKAGGLSLYLPQRDNCHSMIKGKFGSSLRSKSDVGQINEALAKVLCHNVCVLVQAMHELGIEPAFQGLPRS